MLSLIITMYHANYYHSWFNKILSRRSILLKIFIQHARYVVLFYNLITFCFDYIKLFYHLLHHTVSKMNRYFCYLLFITLYLRLEPTSK